MRHNGYGNAWSAWNGRDSRNAQNWRENRGRQWSDSKNLTLDKGKRDPSDKGNLAERLQPLSRRMAMLLRHDGPTQGLVFHRNDWWCKVQDLFKHPEIEGYTLEDIQEVVNESYSKDRPRFEIVLESQQPGVPPEAIIRATHKHTCVNTAVQRPRRQPGPPPAPPPTAPSCADSEPAISIAVTKAWADERVPPPLPQSPRISGPPPLPSPRAVTPERKTIGEGHANDLTPEKVEKVSCAETFHVALEKADCSEKCAKTDDEVAEEEVVAADDANHESVDESNQESEPQETSHCNDTNASAWKRYQMEDGVSYWWWCELDNDCFLEANPGPWTRYMDPDTERYYWWKSEDKWFWI